MTPHHNKSPTTSDRTLLDTVLMVVKVQEILIVVGCEIRARSIACHSERNFTEAQNLDFRFDLDGGALSGSIYPRINRNLEP